MSDEMMVQAQHQAGLSFEISSGSGHRFLVDTDQEGGGQNAGASPMELLLAGLAGCTGISVIGILKKRRQNVHNYAITVHGLRASNHPKVFNTITIEHVVTGHNLNPQAVERAIALTEKQYCGAGAMLSKTAQIQHTIRIVESEENAESPTAPAVAISQ
ncbi:MAG TPA: OsmC family protein [Ktedonobacteraceae bacterium]|nr:OsmC family protein [Ktedonobacteraceae bacterium]